MRLLHQYREGRPWPNGGYPFQDPRTGMKFDGSSADLKLQAQNVIKHRSANPHVYDVAERKYLDLDWVMLEIEDYLCKMNPNNCEDPNAVQQSAADPNLQIQTPEQECPKCGAREWLPQWCQSCGRPKILAFKCAKCAHKL